MKGSAVVQLTLCSFDYPRTVIHNRWCLIHSGCSIRRTSRKSSALTSSSLVWKYSFVPLWIQFVRKFLWILPVGMKERYDGDGLNSFPCISVNGGVHWDERLGKFWIPTVFMKFIKLEPLCSAFSSLQLTFERRISLELKRIKIVKKKTFHLQLKNIDILIFLTAEEFAAQLRKQTRRRRLSSLASEKRQQREKMSVYIMVLVTSCKRHCFWLKCSFWVSHFFLPEINEWLLRKLRFCTWAKTNNVRLSKSYPTSTAMFFLNFMWFCLLYCSISLNTSLT